MSSAASDRRSERIVAGGVDAFLDSPDARRHYAAMRRRGIPWAVARQQLRERFGEIEAGVCRREERPPDRREPVREPSGPVRPQVAAGEPYSTQHPDFKARVAEHRRLLRKRGGRPAMALAAEDWPPAGQAGDWYWDVIQYIPLSGQRVARQLARLCGDDSQVTVPWRSLADAVGVTDKAGHLRGYTERGVSVLVQAGWLTHETEGSKRGARTTFYLQVGERADRTAWLDEAGWVDEDETA